MSKSSRAFNALDRARGIAIRCHAALCNVDPETAAEISQLADASGDSWLTGLPDSPGPFLSLKEAAELCGVSTETVRSWTRRRGLHRYPDGFLKDEVLALRAGSKRPVYQVDTSVDALVNLRPHVTPAPMVPTPPAVRPRSSSNAPRVCATAGNYGDVCGVEVPRGVPVELCGRHLYQAWEYVSSVLSSPAAADSLRRTRELDRAKRVTATTRGRVYYLLIDRLIKIGYASDLSRRLREYPPTAELLSHEAGDAELEQLRHRQFEQFRRCGREWYYPAEPLMLHIASIVAGSPTRLSPIYGASA